MPSARASRVRAISRCCCASRAERSERARLRDRVARVGAARGLPARERRLDRGREAVGLALRVLLVALAELGHDLAREELEGLADVLVLVPAALRDEDHLIDAHLLVAPQQLAHL